MAYDRNDPRAIHETILRDIVDVLMDIKDTDEIQFMFGKNGSFKSVASASSNLTLVFPHLVDMTGDIKTMIMINKAHERNICTMLQMLFSAFSVSDARDAMEYISKFHTNMRMDDDINVDNFIDLLDKMVDGLDESSGIVLNDRELYQAVKEDLLNLKYYLPDSINEDGLCNYKYIRQNGGRIVHEAPATSRPYSNAGSAGVPKISDKSNLPRPRDYKDMSDFHKNTIMDTDIKKANELMPTMMIINFCNRDAADKGVAVVQTSVIGVKVKMYPVDSRDIVERLVSKNKDGNGLNMFIRATTREISFWKDFIFAIEKAKLDALSSSRRGSTSPMWKLLERRAVKSRIRRTFRFTNDATAITMLTINSNTAEFLKKNGVAIEDERVARLVMEAFNLMGIVVVDEAMEAAKFIYDTGNDVFETITFGSLEREASDTTYKKVVNLMTKMR